MASNDVEVLDSTATVEQEPKNSSEVAAVNRRFFMAALGVAGAAAGVALVSSPSAFAQQPKPSGFLEVDVLNFLLNIKYLKATFYSFITQGADLPGSSNVTVGTGAVYNQPAKVTFSSTQLTDLFNEMYYDELNQLIDLRNLIGSTAVARQTINMLGTSAANAAFAAPPATATFTQAQAIGLARMLEDVSTSAFAGALIYLSGKNLAYATQVLASDGFHAGAVRLASIQNGATYQGTGFPITFQIQVGTFLGNNTLYAFLGTVPPVVGSPISGTGILAGSVITATTTVASAAPTGILTSGSNIIRNMSSVVGLVAGQPITGTNIPALTVLTAVGTSTITLSANATASPNVTPTGIVTSGSANVTNVSSISGLVVGEIITGTGIPAGATIVSFSGTTIVMSAAVTASSTVKPTGMTTAGNVNLSAVSSVTGLIVGQPITGIGIPANATIASINATAPFSIMISLAATVTSSSAVTFTSPTTETVTSRTTQAVSIGKSTIAISQPATVTGSTTATMVTPDPMDVSPGDPGTAAASAAGPQLNATAWNASTAYVAGAVVLYVGNTYIALAANTNVTPAGSSSWQIVSAPVYQAFFNTAGGGTSSASTPPGFAFARTFSQVLAVLYNSAAIQTFEGGFYPVGVSGNINVV